MADLTKTITNSVLVLGASNPNLWGTMDWNNNWGTDGFIGKQIGKAIEETSTLSDSYAKDVELGITNTMDMTEDISSIIRGIGIYDYIATRPTPNWVSQVVDGSTIVSDPDSTLTTFAVTATSWTVV